MQLTFFPDNLSKDSRLQELKSIIKMYTIWSQQS